MKSAERITGRLLEEGFLLRIGTRGGSMFPSVASGDAVAVRREESLKRGDVIVFRRDNEMICHRIENIFEIEGARYLRTRGDRLLEPDGLIKGDQVIGKVVNIHRRKVSFARRILLLLEPFLKRGSFNALLSAAFFKSGRRLSRSNLTKEEQTR